LLEDCQAAKARGLSPSSSGGDAHRAGGNAYDTSAVFSHEVAGGSASPTANVEDLYARLDIRCRDHELG
jgi:hypothetical protein